MELRKVFKRGLRNPFRTRLKLYKSCSELPLKNFIKIITTNDYRYLFITDDYDSVVIEDRYDLSVLWGDLVLEYGEIDDNFSIQNSFEDQKLLYQLENSYVVIKSMVRILFFITPDSEGDYSDVASEHIKNLRLLGYNISLESSQEYKKSLYEADKRANSIITRIKLKRNEMKSEDDSKDSSPISFDHMITSLNTALKFSVDDNITVSRYCEYKKVLKSRNTKAA